MFELLLASALTTYPSLWANEYCIFLGTGSTAEEAQQLATDAYGAPTAEAWEWVEKNDTWCPKVLNNTEISALPSQT